MSDPHTLMQRVQNSIKRLNGLMPTETDCKEAAAPLAELAQMVREASGREVQS